MECIEIDDLDIDVLVSIESTNIVLSLPCRGDDSNSCRMLNDEDLFVGRVLNIPGVVEVDGPNISGAYHIKVKEDEMTHDIGYYERYVYDIAIEIGFVD